MAAVDRPLPDLLEALSAAVEVLDPGGSIGDVLRRRGRGEEAELLEGDDPIRAAAVAWDLATELNERRRL